MKTKSIAILALLDSSYALKLQTKFGLRKNIMNNIDVDAKGLQDAYAALAKIEKSESDALNSKELVGTESETNVDEFTGWTGESRSRLVDTSRESDLLQELDTKADGPQRHGLAAYDKPNENWFVQTTDDVDGFNKSHFVKTEIPFPVREKDYDT